VRKLNDICNVITCGVAKRPEYYDDGIPFLSSKNVKSDRFLLNDYKYVSKEDFLSLTKNNKPEKGDILYTRVGSFGEAAVIDFDFDFAIFVSLTLIKPKNDIVLSRYLMHYLNSPKIKHLAKNSTSGVGVQNLNVKVVREFPIQLPPIDQQKKIAAILDAADAYRQKTKALITKYDKLTQSLFLELFGDPVSNLRGWERIKLEEIGTISSGSTPSRKNEENFNGDIPWVKTGEVNSKIIIDTEEKISKTALSNSSCKLYPAGSLIIAMYGQGKTRGQVALLGIEASTNQACAVLTKSDKANFTFLYKLIQMVYNDLRSLGRGGNQPNLNSGILKKYLVINPPIELQNQFADSVKAIEAQKAQAQASLAQAEDLFNSLLQRAFKGELV